MTTDSGPRHFASAFDVPVLTLFGPTHIAWTRTHHPLSLHILHPVDCGPCQQPVCPEGHHRCMRDLDPDAVYRAATRLLAMSRPSPPTPHFGRLGTRAAMSERRPTWLVTGGSGFLGRHLLDRLDREPVEVVALGRRTIPGRRFVTVDLLDGDCLRRVLAELAPSVVFHLAGRTPPADAESLDRSNRIATLRLIEALSRVSDPVLLITAGSAAELGPVPIEELPVGEDHPADPETDYGRSKLAATHAVLDAGGMVARVFNPIGPGTPPSQALGRFAAILADGDGPITLDVGDLAPRRDFIDGRDVADALIALAVRGKPGLYHVGTGESRSVGEGLELLIRHSGRPVRVDVDRSRPSGPADSRADIGRIRREVGWSPRIPFEQSVADLWAAAPGAVAIDKVRRSPIMRHSGRRIVPGCAMLTEESARWPVATSSRSRASR